MKTETKVEHTSELLKVLNDALNEIRECYKQIGADEDSDITMVIEQAIKKNKAINTTEKHFLDMTKEEQEEQNKYDLREMKHYYGGWKELKEVIAQLEDNDNEAAHDRWINSYPY